MTISTRIPPIEDVAIVSYPRSGRTWLAWQLASYFIRAYSLDVSLDFETLYRLIPADGAPIQPHEAFLSRAIPNVRQWHSQSLAAEVKFVMLFRDPRDAIASYYLHEKWQLHETIDDPTDYFRQRASEWTSFMNGWAERLDSSRSMSFSYEERWTAPAKTLQQVLEFIGLEISASLLQDTIERSGFASMLERELSGPRIPGHDYDPQRPEARRVRRGGVGGWSEVLSFEDESVIRSKIAFSASPATRKLLLRTAWDP